MSTVLLVIALTAAPPVLTPGGTVDELVLDREAKGEACALLAGGRAELPERAMRAPWRELASILSVARRCGLRELGLPPLDQGRRVWLELGSGSEPTVLLSVRHRARVDLVASGEVSTLNLAAGRHPAMLLQAFPLARSISLVAAPGIALRDLGQVVAALTRAAPSRLLSWRILLDQDIATLPQPDRLALAVLAGQEVPAALMRPVATSGRLTRMFGSSRAPRGTLVRRPVWTQQWSMLCRRGDERVMLGVGTVSGVHDVVQARITANTRARAVILRKLAEYQRGQVNMERQQLREHRAFMRSFQIIDNWVRPDNKQWYALAMVRAPPKLGGQGLKACPTGTVEEIVLGWRFLDTQGDDGLPRPRWTNAGLGRDADRLWCTSSVPADRPWKASLALATNRARAALADTLSLQAVRASAPALARWPAACLSTMPWLAIAQAARVEIWWDVEHARIYARAVLFLSELRGSLPLGCDPDCIEGLVVARPSRARDGADALEGITRPPWVQHGSGLATEDGGRVFFGVGSVSGIKNHALARTTAENRARAELAKLFEHFSATLVKDYMQLLSQNPALRSEEQHVGLWIKTFSATTLSGVEIIDHWFGPVDGTIYALARLDLNRLVGSLDTLSQIEPAVREYVRKYAAALHERMLAH